MKYKNKIMTESFAIPKIDEKVYDSIAIKTIKDSLHIP